MKINKLLKLTVISLFIYFFSSPLTYSKQTRLLRQPDINSDTAVLLMVRKFGCIPLKHKKRKG